MKWLHCYSSILKQTIILYNLNISELSVKVGVTDAAIRQWLSGRNFPSKSVLDNLYLVLAQMLTKTCDTTLAAKLYSYIEVLLKESSETIDVCLLEKVDIGKFLTNALKFCYTNDKTAAVHPTLEKKCSSSNRTQAVVFDFDGTLTETHTTRTTWETIWTELGYDVEECRDLHAKFNRKEISHVEWCRLTSAKFRDKGLNKELLIRIASNIRIMPGCKETFEYLWSKNIKIFIVSGSILFVIQTVLKDQYFLIDEVKANDLRFASDGTFSEIIGTKYDFEGKATFIQEVSKRLKIPPSDILFIGNSYNDKYVHISGARTLCINPRNTDPSDCVIWNNCIFECAALNQVLKYIY